MTLTLDTSGMVALVDRDQPMHERVTAALRLDGGPYIVPAGILAELAYVLEVRASASAMETLLLDLEEGRLLYDCGEHDFARIRELVVRYENLPLGFADAAVIACAERQIRPTVLTVDRRDFDIVAREGTIEVVP